MVVEPELHPFASYLWHLAEWRRDPLPPMVLSPWSVPKSRSRPARELRRRSSSWVMVALHQLGDVGRRIRIVLAHGSPPISKLLDASIPTAWFSQVEPMRGVGDYNYTKTLQRMSDSDTTPLVGTFQSFGWDVI